MGQSGSKTNSITIELARGPLDGTIRTMDPPFEATIVIQSEFRSDVRYVYTHDNSPEKNKSFPLIFRFMGYEKD